MTTLNIITPVTRSHNLPVIYDSIVRALDRQSSGVGIPARQSSGVGIPARQSSGVGIPARQSSGVGIPARQSTIDNRQLTIRWLFLPDPRFTTDVNVYSPLDNLKILVLKSPELASYDKHYFSAGYLRNKSLDLTGDGWIWFLDDDNICHPDFLWRLSNLIENFHIPPCSAGGNLRGGSTSAFLFSQLNPNGKLRHVAIHKNIGLYYVDMAQLIIHYSLLKNYKFQDNCRTDDGRLIEQIYRDHPLDFMLVRDPLVYYNYLRPVQDPLWRRLKFFLKRTLYRSLP